MLRCPKCKKQNYHWHSKKQLRYTCRECGHIFNQNNGLLAEHNFTNGLKEPLSTEPLLDIIDDPISDILDANGTSREITSTEIISMEDLLEYCQVDTSVWEVESYLINKWPTSSFNSDTVRTINEDGGFSESTRKDPIFANNVQVKIKLRKLVNIRDWDWFKQDFLDSVAKKSLKVPKIKYKKPKGDYARNMLVINLYDLHIGKLGWNPETLDGNYDYKIARERFHAAIDYMIMKASVYDIEQIVVPWGHDFFNSDQEGTGFASTTAGTAQQNDVRWQKMWIIGRELSMEMIEKLKILAPVKVIVTPGNHDTQKMFYLGDLLSMVYKNDPNVEVDNEPRLRKYHRYGNTLLGCTHSVGGKHYPPEDRLLALMPAEIESRYDFAETQFHEWLVGHTHHRSKKSQMDYKDHQGIVIRVLTSLSAADAWHSDLGFKGAVKGADALVYNYMTGQDAYFPYNLVYDEKNIT